jgi:uncharacterized protein
VPALRNGVICALLAFCTLQPVESEPESLEHRLLFQPHQGRVAGPKDAGLPVQDLYFDTEDGVTLNAWWLPAKPGQGTVLYFHGNGGNVSYMGATMEQFRRCGLGAFLVDYRGYGMSMGHPTEAGLYKDAAAAYRECLQRGISPAKLIIHGQSLGGGVAVFLASQKPCAGLIVESSFTSARHLAKLKYGAVAAAIMHSQFPSVQMISKVSCPVLVIHGTLDEVIPVAMGREVYAAVRSRKALWIVEGAGHNNLRSLAGDDYGGKIRAFAMDCLKRSSKTPARSGSTDPIPGAASLMSNRQN